MAVPKQWKVVKIVAICAAIGASIAFAVFFLWRIGFMPIWASPIGLLICPPILLLPSAGESPLRVDTLEALTIAAVCNALFYGAAGAIIGALKMDA
ncbi:MAG: hypothetical protein ABSC76_14890 [Terracidiphilus sp.]|jgi:hypothetical protein